MVLPEMIKDSVFDETFVGSSNVFSSSGLAELSAMALPFPESFPGSSKI